MGVCQLPQSPGVPAANCIPELRRCVEELGFVGCNLNPDPSGGYWQDPPLTDRFDGSGANLRADETSGKTVRFRRVPRELDPACFASSARKDLGLDDERPVQITLLRVKGSSRNAHPVACEQGFALVLAPKG